MCRSSSSGTGTKSPNGTGEEENGVGDIPVEQDDDAINLNAM